MLLLLPSQTTLFVALLLCACVATDAFGTHTGIPRKLAQAHPMIVWDASQCVRPVGSICYADAGYVVACCVRGSCEQFLGAVGVDHITLCNPGSALACCPTRAARG
jgi:hypothetical protein